MGATRQWGMSTPHELRRRLAHGLRLGAAGVVVAGQARPGVGGARALAPATVLGETALLCRVAGRLLADDPFLARFEGLGAAQARLGEAVTRALDPHLAALAVAADPRCRTREAFPFALLGDLDIGHRSVARHLFDLARDDLGDEPDPCRPPRALVAAGPGRRRRHPRRPHRLGAGARRRPAARRAGRRLRPHPRRAARHRLRPALRSAACARPPRWPTTLRPCSVQRWPAATSTSSPSCSGPGRCSTCRSAPAPATPWPSSTGPRPPTASCPARGTTPPSPPGLSPADRSTYVIQTSFHTAVAGAVLAAALLRTVPTDGDGRALTGGRPASARRTAPTPDADPLPLLAHADGPWADDLRARPLDTRVGCTPLLVGAELRTATAQGDPAQVHHVVAWAADHGWAHLPSVRQGAALLSRLARVAAQPVTLAS